MDFEVLFLGLLQGVTEFLPVSSSGHLSLAKVMMGINDPSLSFDLVLHIATLVAVVAYFARDIVSLLLEWLYGFINPNARNWAGWRFGWAVIAGSCVTAPLGIILKNIAESATENLLWLGGNFWITGLLLLSTRFIPEGWRNVRVRDGAVIGLVQGLAVLPGISRSGSTIWSGMLCGLSRDEAFRFSFLLSIPAILGATLIEARDLGGYEMFIANLPAGWPLSAVIAFLSGLASLILLRKLVTSEKWWMFAIYCMLLGNASVALSIMEV